MIGLLEAGTLLGQVELKVQGQPIGKVPGLLLGDVVLIVLLSVGVLLGLMALTKYIYTRRPKKRHSSEARKVFRSGDGKDDEEEKAEEAADARRRYKYRWKRRQHRARNPSLAETGGLPPERGQDSTQPS